MPAHAPASAPDPAEPTQEGGYDGIEVETRPPAAQHPLIEALESILKIGGGMDAGEPTIAQRLTRNHALRNGGPAAIAVSNVSAPGGQFVIHLCSGLRHTSDLAEHLGIAGGISVVMIDLKLGGEAHDITRPEVRLQLEI